MPPEVIIKKLKSRKLLRAERRKLILTLVGQNWTMTVIARKLGISRQRVHQLASGHKGN